MGINDLLKIVRDGLIHTHISNFSGKVAAVDMMNWIYRGVYSCSAELNNGLEVDIYLNFPIKMLSMLRSYNISIVAVFDGNEIQAKEKIDRQRKDEKNKNLQLANKLSLEGNVDGARNISRRAMKITGKILNTIIEILKKLGVKIIVAPYEADSQIAYLCIQNLCDFAISEDSDLIVYGCNRVLYKLGADGNCLYYNEDYIFNIRRSNKNNTNNIDTIIPESQAYLGRYDHIRTLNRVQRLEFCVLLGCDYLPSIKGVGVIRCIDMFKKNKYLNKIFIEMKKNHIYSKELSNLKFDYLNEAERAVTMFLLQTVYDPLLKELVSVNDSEFIKYKVYFDNEYTLGFKTLNEKEEYYGRKSLRIALNQTNENLNLTNNYVNINEYCNGLLDVRKLTKEKDLETIDTINKYFNKYRYYFHDSINYINNNIKADNIFEDRLNNGICKKRIFFNNFSDNNSKNLNNSLINENYINKAIEYLDNKEKDENYLRIDDEDINMFYSINNNNFNNNSSIKTKCLLEEEVSIYNKYTGINKSFNVCYNKQNPEENNVDKTINYNNNTQLYINKDEKQLVNDNEDISILKLSEEDIDTLILQASASVNKKSFKILNNVDASNNIYDNIKKTEEPLNNTDINFTLNINCQEDNNIKNDIEKLKEYLNSEEKKIKVKTVNNPLMKFCQEKLNNNSIVNNQNQIKSFNDLILNDNTINSINNSLHDNKKLDIIENNKLKKDDINFNNNNNNSGINTKILNKKRAALNPIRKTTCFNSLNVYNGSVNDFLKKNA